LAGFYRYFDEVIDLTAIKSRFDAVSPFLDERGRRLVAASEALAAGRGGIQAVSAATAVARSTIGRGLAELRGGANHLGGRVRRAGGGRKAAVDQQAGLLETLGELVGSAIRGDPEAALLWVSKSQRHLAGALVERGFVASHKLVGRLLRRLGFTLQANRKTREGTSHPDRDAQFEHINAQVSRFQAAGQPAISVDTKKKELVGDFKNAGRELRPKGEPEPVRVHDFKIPELGKVAPYGVYDIAANTGWVNLGIDHDTAAFAPGLRRGRLSIRRWWLALGRERYPAATRLLITADCGGSNGARVRLWKRELQTFANQSGPSTSSGGGHAHPPPARHQQMEPDRTSPLRLHYTKLARQAAHLSRGDHPTDRGDHNQRRPRCPLLPRRERLSQGDQGLRRRNGRNQHHA
jgi:transposase